MDYEFSKLELWWKKADENSQLADAIIFGQSTVKIYERKWYNPFRYFLATHGVRKITAKDFFL